MLDAWRGGDLSEPEVAREVVAALPGEALLWCGNSLSVRDVDLTLPPQANARVMASRGASGIDGTFSTAAGAALAHAADHPGAVAFALIGDLSLLHDAPGLAIGPGEPRPDLCVVVVNNDGGGIFEGLEPARFGGGVSGRPTAERRSAAHRVRADVRHPARRFRRAPGGRVRHPLLARGAAGRDRQGARRDRRGGGPRIVEARTGRAPNADLRARMRAAALAALRG